MAIIDLNGCGPVAPECSLDEVLRMEQSNLNCFPSSKTDFDGGWLMRISSSNPSKRINSLNFFDKSDNENVGGRLDYAQHTFKRLNVPFNVRWTPLTPDDVDSEMDQRHYTRYSETLVLRRAIWSLGETEIPSGLQIKEVSFDQWVDCYRQVGGTRDDFIAPEALSSLKSVMCSVIAPSISLVAVSADNIPLAVVSAVLDKDQLGVMNVATHPDHRRSGLAHALVLKAHEAGASKGAQFAWLQVVKANAAGRKLYANLGYKEAYRYHYCSPR
ncbi:GNAT family N-acetyltransferase [Flexibacterium corallicola]|uniref:GNAT family N-acetyltransferase n=1 Tax=Flexibacterium corallicola TaxID=3037259 RepID=UPI00286ED260|nr:GNAT family N-acetyltransferase [Pseudovibrio sp. M1P-2-3]